MSAFVVATAITSAAVLVGFISFLIFCAVVVRWTGGTAGLRDVAVAMRAFRGIHVHDKVLGPPEPPVASSVATATQHGAGHSRLAEDACHRCGHDLTRGEAADR
jgi:hypothetical protein